MDRNKKILIAACAVAIALIIVVGILLAMFGRDKTPLSERTLHLSVNGCDIEVPLKKNNVTVNAPSLAVGENTFEVLGYPGGTVKANGKTVNLGQLMKLMALGVKQGTEVTITCDGANEEEAAAGLLAFLEENL